MRSRQHQLHATLPIYRSSSKLEFCHSGQMPIVRKSNLISYCSLHNLEKYVQRKARTPPIQKPNSNQLVANKKSTQMKPADLIEFIRSKLYGAPRKPKRLLKIASNPQSQNHKRMNSQSSEIFKEKQRRLRFDSLMKKYEGDLTEEQSKMMLGTTHSLKLQKRPITAFNKSTLRHLNRMCTTDFKKTNRSSLKILESSKQLKGWETDLRSGFQDGL